jgi:hypothetical protein
MLLENAASQGGDRLIRARCLPPEPIRLLVVKTAAQPTITGLARRALPFPPPISDWRTRQRLRRPAYRSRSLPSFRS